MTEVATAAEARRRADVIRMGMVAYDQTLKAIAEAYAARDWEALGHPDWDTYIAEEFSEARVRLSTEQRAQAVLALRIEGMSQRAIASALGASQATVRRDLSGESFDSPEEKITGADGKSYASKSATRRRIPEPAAVPEVDVEWEPTTAATEADESELTSAAPEPVAMPARQNIADAVLDGIDEHVAAKPSLSDAVERFLPPDTDGPRREWNIRFLDALRPCVRLMAQFNVSQVVDSADEECLDELANLAEQIVSYRDRVRAARPVPDNVRHLRAV